MKHKDRIINILIIILILLIAILVCCYKKEHFLDIPTNNNPSDQKLIDEVNDLFFGESGLLKGSDAQAVVNCATIEKKYQSMLSIYNKANQASDSANIGGGGDLSASQKARLAELKKRVNLFKTKIKDIWPNTASQKKFISETTLILG